MELIIDVIGAKCFRGTVNGQKIDSGSVFGIVRLDERYNKTDQDGVNWKLGHAVEEWRLPNADSVLKIAHLKPSIKTPVSMRLDIERVSNGKETREIVVDINPVNGTVVDQATGEVKQITPVPAPAPARKAA